MIKLIIFDLDGVLVDTRNDHYKALNMALESIDPKYVISKEEHLAKFDGLPTTKKLRLLTKDKGLPVELYDTIWKKKQEMTSKIIENEYQADLRVIEILRHLKELGYTLAVASNAVRSTVKNILLKKGFMSFIDFYYSNQDVINHKPHPEIYFKCMSTAGVNVKETLIVEDSHIGREAALSSGAFLCAVENPNDLTEKKLKDSLLQAEDIATIKPKWQGGKLNVLIPMAGAGKRFADAGYTFPKPLIEVNGKPMIQVIVENLNMEANYIFIVQKEHYDKYSLSYLLNLIAPNCKIVQIEGITEGAAVTTLKAKEYIDNDSPLLIANSDQVVEGNSNEWMYSFVADEVDGGILTFKSTHPKWSFAKTDENGLVTEVAEKKPISDNATVGIYYWRKGSDYVKYAERMIARDIRTNGEFYVCPVFNEAIEDNKKIKVYNVPKMWGIGTPEDLERYLHEFSN